MTSAHIGAGMSVVALIVLLVGCGDDGDDARIAPTPIPTATVFDAARFRGAYAASVSGGDGFATVSGGIALHLFADADSSVSLSGGLDSDGTAVVSGDGIFQGDIYFEMRADLRVTEANGIQRISGETADGSYPSAYFRTFLLERPSVHDSSVYSGAYRITFMGSPSGCECATTATFTLESDADGFAVSTAVADERDATSRVVGRFSPGSCVVVGTGGVRCDLVYTRILAPPPGAPFISDQFGVTLLGSLGQSGESLFGGGWLQGAIFSGFFGTFWEADGQKKMPSSSSSR